MNKLPSALIHRASLLYRSSGLYANRFAAGKLGGDPIFAYLFREGLLNSTDHRTDDIALLDLGCGQGLLAACCAVAPLLVRTGHWPTDWAPPPTVKDYRGFELIEKDARRGQKALQAENWVDIKTGDLRHCDFGRADIVVLLDVLHYLPLADHAPILSRIHAALPVGGRLITRLGDAEGGTKNALARLIDQTVWMGRTRHRNSLHYRSTGNWRQLLEASGFQIESFAPVPGERFANHLLVASRA